MKHPRKLGEIARKTGKYINPFPEGTREFNEWRDGYIWEAQAEEEDRFQAAQMAEDRRRVQGAPWNLKKLPQEVHDGKW